MADFDFQEDDTQEGGGVFKGNIPSYMVASNNHNVGNMNNAWTEANPDSSFAERTVLFVGSSIASGLNSFRNTGIAVGNLFSEEDTEYVKTEDMIAGFDENMAEYYKENRQAADLVGFVASSLIPGTGGVKVFNAGAKALMAAKAGNMGSNMAKGFGILPGARQTLVAEASQAYATSRAAFSLGQAQTAKAIAAGFGENILQSAAFETAVAATMFKSPILEDMDIGDLMGNIVTGALVGGAIGGVIDAARSVSQIKRGVKELDVKLKDVTQLARGADGTSASDSMLISRNDMSTTRINAPDGVDPTLYSNLYEDKARAIGNEIRAKWGEIAGGDQQVANLLHKATQNDGQVAFAQKVLNLEAAGGVADIGKHVASAEKKAIAAGVENTVSMKYATVFGDDFGKIADEAPSYYSIADHLPKGQTVEVTPKGVKWGKSTHEVKVGEIWDASKNTVAQNEARHMWANDPSSPTFAKIMEAEAKRIAAGNSKITTGGKLIIGEKDIAMLGKAYREGFTNFVLAREGKTLTDPVTGLVSKQANSYIDVSTRTQAQHLEYIAGVKDRILTRLAADALKTNNPETVMAALTKRLDVTEGWANGAGTSADLEKSLFGLQAHREKWYQRLYRDEPQAPDIATLAPWKEKQTIGMAYNTRGMEAIDPMHVEAMTVIKQRQKLQEATNANAAAKTLEDTYQALPEWNNNLLGSADRVGAGPSFISYANGAYGSLASFAEFVGSIVTKRMNRNVETIGDTFASVNHKLVNDPDKVTELATIFQKVRGAGQHKYVIHENEIVLKSYRDHLLKQADNAAEGLDELGVAPVEYIPPAGVDVKLLANPEVLDWLKVHVAQNGKRVDNGKIRNGARGLDDNLQSDIIYAPTPSPSRFTHHAFVVDESIRDTGHVSMLYAADARALEAQMSEARKQGFTVLTKADTAQYYRAKGEYEFSQGFNENYIDSALASTGASASHFPITGTPTEMVQDWMAWHVSQENMAVRDAVKLKYSMQMGTLNKMSEAYEGVQSSTRRGFFDKFKSQVKNPYQDYIKTMMGVSRQDEYPVWKAINESIDRAGSKVVNTVNDIWETIRGKGKADAYDIDRINATFDKYGLRMAATDAQLQAWVNHPAGTAAVTKFIGQQNAILSTLTLRLDPINALNNALGSTILTGAEVKAVQRAIAAGDSSTVGALSQLKDIRLPGVEDAITSPAKLIAGAYADILGSGGKAFIDKYKGLNLVVDQAQQFRNLLETVTIDGTETAAVLESKSAKAIAMMKTFADAGEKWTGNKFAEQMNRAVSARIMDKITQVAVDAGVMDSKTANTYINTFVNRTQANIIASQRPQMFQGPLGQAIGLFQSYQFNIMQQLLRHVGEGNTKDALTLLGMQSTVYGASGLPAFQAINTHIIGNASGNKEHKDLYTAVNGVLGKDVGDWFTYGLASNIFIHPDLKVNLYSRGDINPRSLSIVPTSLAEMPAAGMWVKAFQTSKDTLSRIGNGGDVWNSMLAGLEQQGINRPMKGLAQALRGIGEGNMSYSGTKAGNVISANDFFSLANLARVSGAKPFDEAVAQDALFRVQTYQAKDKAQRESLGKAVRTVVANGQAPSQEQMEGFMDSYAKLGGQQPEFSKWYVSILKNATTPQVNKIVEKSNSPYANYMQEIMGGKVYNTPLARAASIPEQE